MMRLRIDGVECKLRDENAQLPRYGAKMCESVQGWRENVEMSLVVEATANAVELFCHAEDMHRAEEFNATQHWGVVEVDGVPLFEGEATVRGIERVGDVVYYRVHLRALGHEWAHSVARTQLKNSGLEVAIPMTLDGVERSWERGQAVTMLPLRYDSYPEPEETGLYITQRLWMPSDYYPFISVAEVVKRAISAGGYKLKSRFFDTEFMSRLMMSGAYKRVDSTLLQSKMGFKAMRSVSTEAAAGEDGRVYAWLPVMASNIGGLVDTVDPTTVDEKGAKMVEAYSNGGCFTFDEGRPIFTPTREINVAFNIHLHYTTDYRIASSRYLHGFTSLHLSNGCNVEVKLHNPFLDMRNSVVSNMMFKLFIFDYNPNDSYMLDGYGAVSGRVSSILFSNPNGGVTQLKVKRMGSSGYVDYDGDWALYGGFVSETGTREVVVDIRTPYESITPTNPKRFNDIYFGGALEGQQMTLHAGCSIEPIFGGSIGYGEVAEFADVANVDVSQAELLEAVAHLFNLRFYSHAPSKTLYVEPYDDFYGGREVDWCDRQIGGSEVISECAVESFVDTQLGYQPADGAAARYTKGEERDLGTWDYHVENYAAKRSTERLLNPLFRPVASFAGAASTAPMAQVLTVGDRDKLVAEGYVEPRVVLYYGVEALDDGDYWPSPNGDRGYPLALFHSRERRETLCFDDRDGCAGLHSYYNAELQERSTRQKLECDLRLSPVEYAALFDLNSDVATICSNFRLKVCGQSALFRLEAIESYDVKSHVAHCVFVRRLSD